ncbi:MAG TPA: hypothetical protein VFA27_16010 [Vicinamibacterales bacterium]|nr:hypothetical protein [Vicinamibacterales bacterium]
MSSYARRAFRRAAQYFFIRSDAAFRAAGDIGLRLRGVERDDRRCGKVLISATISA